jgi:hypothetical protein
MSSFDRIRKMRKLNNWFSLKRRQQQQQQQQQVNRFNLDHHQIPVQQTTHQFNKQYSNFSYLRNYCYA